MVLSIQLVGGAGSSRGPTLGRLRGSGAYLGAAFEAFDLGWKSEASGIPLEGRWGLLLPDCKAVGCGVQTATALSESC